MHLSAKDLELIADALQCKSQRFGQVVDELHNLGLYAIATEFGSKTTDCIQLRNLVLKELSYKRL
jgi:hypothetical protein